MVLIAGILESSAFSRIADKRGFNQDGRHLGTQKDIEEAKKWFRKAAKRKHAGAKKALESLEGK